MKLCKTQLAMKKSRKSHVQRKKIAKLMAQILLNRSHAHETVTELLKHETENRDKFVDENSKLNQFIVVMKKMTINVNNLINQKYSLNYLRSVGLDFVVSVFFDFGFFFAVYSFLFAFNVFSIDFFVFAAFFSTVSMTEYVISIAFF